MFSGQNLHCMGPKKRFRYDFLNGKYIVNQYNFNQHLILYLSRHKKNFSLFTFYIRQSSSLKSTPREKRTLMAQVIWN